jgi:hypothetical protein
MNLNDEYSPKAARQAEARAANQQRKENNRLALASDPLPDDKLDAAARQLANALGGRVTRPARRRKQHKQ